MTLALLFLFQTADQTETTFNEPSYFVPVILGLLVFGAILWLVAAVLGFARARAFGASTRWFCLPSQTGAAVGALRLSDLIKADSSSTVSRFVSWARTWP